MCQIQELLDKAKEHIDKISFRNVITLEGPGDYSFDGGKARMTVIQDRGKVEIIHGKFEPGTRTERHSHTEKEIYVCYSGDLTINDDVTLGEGDTYYIVAGMPHVVSSKNGAELLVVRVPSSRVLEL